MSTKIIIISTTDTNNRSIKTPFIRARKLAAHSGMTMNALRLIFNKPELNPNQQIFPNKKD